MRILFLTQFFSDTRGGGETVFRLWSEELAKRGHQIFVICHRILNPQLNNQLTKVHLEVIPISPALTYKGGVPASLGQNIVYLINSVKWGIRLVKKYHFDVIHANNFTPTIAAYVISKTMGVPFVSTIHDIFSNCGAKYWKTWTSELGESSIATIIGPMLERVTIKIPPIIHAVSSTTRRDIIQSGRQSGIVVIFNGINLEDYRTQSQPVLKENQITFIGRNIFYKNLDVVLKALEIVGRTVPDVHLVVVGDGPSRHRWERLAHALDLDDSVTFRGHLSHTDKLKMLSRSKALVFPSTIEGFGLVILEAFAMEKPVIASNVAPMTEIISDGVDGYLASPFDPNDWAMKITYLLEHPKMARRMGMKGRIKVERQYTIQKVVDKLERLYELIGDRS